MACRPSACQDPTRLRPGTVLWSIANIATWTYAGYNMLIIFDALQAIPTEIYEAARVDGCTCWRVAWSVKIPLVAPALILTCIFSIVGSLQLFAERPGQAQGPIPFKEEETRGK
jgi:multiple sugar transport system permease protein